ncbi:MAG: AhpC/TSA family protein [Candidatus Rokubacteria bacterium]|nr:AhpC/TSA family protein [Candidatus Rokubacteria bacterium]
MSSFRRLEPGDRAPDFTLPAVNREGTVSLGEFRGKRPVLLALFRGLHCPFCRRQLVQLTAMREKVNRAGVETLAVVNTPLDRARLYFKYHPTRVLLAADPEAGTHRLFRLPAFELGEVSEWPLRTTAEEFGAVRVNPSGELAVALQPMEANDELNRREGFQLTEVDQQILRAHGTQLAGHFLIDREGIVRWTHVEAWERIGDLTIFPSEEEILAAARALPR